MQLSYDPIDHAETRLAEISDLARRGILTSDLTWAEILRQTTNGSWAAAFELRSGVVRMITAPVFVPITARATGG